MIYIPSAARVAVFAAAALLAAPLALAHGMAGSPHEHGLLAGLSHPFGGLDHLLAMVAVGMLALQAGRRAVWLLPACFLFMMGLGGVLGTALPALQAAGFPLVEAAIAASVLAAGLALLRRQAPALGLSALATGIFAVFHGIAHAAEMPDTAAGWMYGTGFLLATAALHGLGLGLALLARRFAAQAALRAMGAAVSCVGIALLLVL